MYKDNIDTIIRISDGAIFPKNERNIDYLNFLDWQKAGGILEPYAPPAPAPVTEIDSRRALLALDQMGYYSAVEQAVGGMSNAAKINWYRATTWLKNDPLILEVKDLLNLTESDLTQLFELASTL